MIPRWRKTLFLAAGFNILILAFNLAILLWALPRHDPEEMSGILYEGQCSKVQRMSGGLHFVVNVLSTFLLAASVYCMQCLSAPSRENIDRAHRRGAWMDIGIPSIRNLRRIPATKSVLWVVLLICSLSLHFIYNATVFAVVSANDYNVFVGPRSLGQTPLDEISLHYNVQDATIWPSFSQLHAQAQDGSLSLLSPSHCFDAYTASFQVSHRSLLVVTNSSGADYIALSHEVVFDPRSHTNTYTWICRTNNNSTCLDAVRDEISRGDWTIEGARVESCLAQTSLYCKLAYNLPLTIVVVALNLIKAGTMIITAVRMESPILTTGDAVASFINRPDRITIGHCLLSRDRLKSLYENQPETTFHPEKRRWSSSVSWKGWVTWTLSCLLPIITTLALLIHSINQTQQQSSPWTYSHTDPETLITTSPWPTSPLANSLIANTPHLLLSLCYLTTEPILTTMTLSSEWSNFALLRRGLRVVSTTPSISQRTSSYLSLPPRYALPSLIFFAILHFLASQSFFVFVLQTYTAMLDRDAPRDRVTVGFVPPAILASLGLATAGFIMLLCLSRRRFVSAMPVAGSCSLAIAAACHPHSSTEGQQQLAEGNPQAGCFPLKWGHVDGHWGFSW